MATAPTKTFHADGTGVAAIVRYSAYTNGANSPAILTPEQYPTDVFFHSSFKYLQPDFATSNSAGVNITFPARAIVYYTWDDSSHCDVGCFITTAVCQSLGLPDDCEELQTLRWFRDNVMAKTEAGRKKIDWYYQNAPKLVEALNARQDVFLIYHEMYCGYVLLALHQVQAKNFEGAERTYENLIDYAISKVGGSWDKP